MSVVAKLPVADRVYNAIREMVAAGRFRSGEPISEVRLSAELEVSRTPVREAVRTLGVVGEIAGVFFDADGIAVTPELARCVVGLSDARLRAIPRVCAVVLGAAKAPAVRAAVAGGLVDSLIIDSALGEALLDG